MRFLATVSGVSNRKPVYIYQEGEAKSDCPKYDKMVELTGIISEDGTSIPDTQVLYSKVFSQNSTKIFVGNKISFDAKYNDNKFSSIRNICGLEAEWLGDIDSDSKLVSSAVLQKPWCGWCSQKRQRECSCVNYPVFP